ncbi:acyltransferase family protein [Undibacterium sp.]|uniref:acyltransferase family protein n=1 Tax=Undibacterium sp. TaxID=1914977 RepID=UPI00374D3A55
MQSLSATAPPFRLDFLDGLRALAALWVMFGHIHLFSYGWDHHTSLLTIPLNGLLYLHMGVDVFLVLSGFCLALPVVRNGNQMRTGLLGYFKARSLRILPPYFAVLLLILAVNFFLPIVTWGRHPMGLTSDIPYQVLLSNFLLLQDLFPQFNGINGPFWSIATEWHLYFLFPLAIWLLRKFGAWTLLISGALLAAALTWRSLNASIILESLQMSVPQPPYFVLLFVMGIVSAWFVFGENSQPRNKTYGKVIWAAAALLLLPLGWLLWKYRIIDGSNVHLFMDNTYQIDPVAGAVTALALAGLSGLPVTHIARRFLETRVLVWIGGFSYSLYLVHIPILATLAHALDILMPQKTQHHAFFLLSLIGGGLCMGFAYYFSKVFETRLWMRPFVSPSAKETAQAIRLRMLELEKEHNKLKQMLEEMSAIPLREGKE